MAPPTSIGLSNPYDGRAAAVDARPARARPVLARAAVLAGVTGATAVGLGAGTSGAWADTSTAAPVSRWDGHDMSCLRLREPVMDGAATATRTPARGRAARVSGRPVAVDGWMPSSRAWPTRCGSAPWVDPGAVDPGPWTPRPWTPKPVDPPAADPKPVDPPAGDPVDGAQVVSVQGTVEDGVEPGCVVLSGGDGQQWTLTGPLRTLPHGVPLSVTGTTTPGTLSTCMQGEVLRVGQVALADGDDPAPAVPIATTDLLAESRPVTVRPVAPVVEPACGPTGNGKIPSVALCTR